MLNGRFQLASFGVFFDTASRFHPLHWVLSPRLPPLLRTWLLFGQSGVILARLRAARGLASHSEFPKSVHTIPIYIVYDNIAGFLCVFPEERISDKLGTQHAGQRHRAAQPPRLATWCAPRRCGHASLPRAGPPAARSASHSGTSELRKDQPDGHVQAS